MFLPCFTLGLMIARFRKFFSITALIFAANTVTAAEETSGDLIDRAQKEFSRGRRDAATALATKAIETDPKNPRGYFARARIYRETSEPAKALTDYDQTIKLDPGIAEAWQDRGIIHFKLARIGESISDFDQFLKLNPAQTPYIGSGAFAITMRTGLKMAASNLNFTKQ